MNEELLKLVNHEAWIECRQEGRAYLKWGHMPQTDGKLDPRVIKKAFVVSPEGKEKPIALGVDRDSSAMGAMFLEFDARNDGIHTIAVEYDRGIYSVTKDKKWIFGEKKHVSGLGYDVEEARWLLGSAKAYAGEREVKPEPLGLELEIVPEVVRKFKAGEKLGIQLFFGGKPLQGEVRVRSREKTVSIQTDESGFAEVELAGGVNVISARHVEESATPEKFDRRNITTTLTVIVG